MTQRPGFEQRKKPINQETPNLKKERISLFSSGFYKPVLDFFPRSISSFKKRNSLSITFMKLKQEIKLASWRLALIVRLFGYIRSEISLLIFSYLSLIITSWAQIKMPDIITHIIDSIITYQDWNKMQKEVLIFLLVAVIFSVSEFFWGFLFPMLSHKIRATLKTQVYSSILTREIEFFDKKHLNELLNHLDHQINQAQTICTDKFSSIGRNLIQLGYSAWMLAALSNKLTLFLILIIPLYLALSLGYSFIFEKIAKHEITSFNTTNKRILEALQNIKIIKAFSSEKFETNIHDNLLEKTAHHTKKVALVSSTNLAVSGLFTNLTLLCIVYIGMNMINKGEVTPGTLSSFLLYAVAVPIAFRDASMSYLRLKECLPSCEEIFKLIDDKPKIPYKGGKIIPNFQGKIQLKGVDFTYPSSPNVPILNNISVTINPGESVAFVGMSGGGKSTIISILLRFYDISKGEVSFDDYKIQDIDLQWLHQQIGYVSQEPLLFSGTIERNITYGLPSYTKEKLLSAITMANADFIFDSNLLPQGLNTEVGDKGARLSGGQKQRISIARALIKEPKILIFDEATSNLDANSEFEVQKAINNLITNSQITTITIAHRLATIVKCKTIYVLKGGEIIEKGSHKELIARDTAYKALFERQFQTKH